MLLRSHDTALEKYANKMCDYVLGRVPCVSAKVVLRPGLELTLKGMCSCMDSCTMTAEVQHTGQGSVQRSG